MSEIINLNKARKARRKDQKAATAAQNRVTYGIPARERRTAIENQRLEGRKLDQLRVEKNDADKKS
ncbi:DUF4169 family protein [Asticcacaulis sp. YBE204]|uniref:DUF4169 family protein n=1 Tax=Asticcacaulis sp. YBE204 TaxID=1282363 RepID=UPI0003C3FF76|nr:DUF4169 family protein [Asticcacaulis sp. YBE204]ESQ79922.1 hypothetical protein AEYBE204_08730 [Asticcacaulis sp. YBE204]